MPLPLPNRPHSRWTRVGAATLLGTLGCMVVAVAFNSIAFADMPVEVRARATMSAAAISILLGTPLFLYASLRLRGMAISNVRLNQLARTDGLTSCLNRAAFVAKTESAMAKAKRFGRSGGLLMIDADNFKAINDAFGHHSGDEALTIIARTIRAVARRGDLVGRIGGEEFAVYLPNADRNSVMMLAERIRRAVVLAYFAPHDRRHPLSVSIGGAHSVAPRDFVGLFHEADQNLYLAKQSGRNRIAFAAEPHTVEQQPSAPLAA